MSQLRRLIVLTQDQLDKLRGLSHNLTEQYDENRKHVLGSVAKKVKRIGPTQAYVQYRAAQQRHLQQAALERAEPMRMELTDAPAAPPTFEEKLRQVEEQSAARLLREQKLREIEAARKEEEEDRAFRALEDYRQNKLLESEARKAYRKAKQKRSKENQILRRSTRTVEKAKEKLRQEYARRENIGLSRVSVVSPSAVELGAKQVLKNPAEARWIKLHP